MYKDRIEAGLVLAEELKKFNIWQGVILAIPRGGVPVGYAIAKELDLLLDIILIKKLGHPFQKEYAIGAVSLNSRVLISHPDVSLLYIEEETIRIRERLRQMYQQFKGNKPGIDITGKKVIIVDDGIATGQTLSSAIDLIKESAPSKIIIAVPVASKNAIAYISKKADEIICPLTPKTFYGVGAFYEDFRQVSDEEVAMYLEI